jgi:C4-dicarboxylate transporter DctM subunit
MFLIFLVLVGFIMLGAPVLVGMGVTAMTTFQFMGDGRLLTMLPQRMFSATTGFTLLAIPFFILAGNLMNTGGITTRIFNFARALVGHIWGGLGQVNVMASMIFSGMSGAAVADAAGLGMIELKAMEDNGYERDFSAAITCASSTIGPVVPPSIPFVIYGSITGVSVARLFLAGFTPGFMMGIAMMIGVAIVSKVRRYPKEKRAPIKVVLQTFLHAVLPIGTPVIIIGGILGGWFTPTEAAVVACIYTMILGLVVYREIKLKDLPRIFWESILQSAKVLIIIAVAGFFGWMLVYFRIPNAMLAALLGLSTSPTVILLLIMAVLLVLGCFLEGVAVLVITIPLFMPIIQELGIHPVQFGVIMTLASMIGLITPPVGMSLYAVSSISGVPLGRLSKELLPYLFGIFVCFLLVSFIPWLSLWLPDLAMGPGLIQ